MTTITMMPNRERRRRDLASRIARLTWPVRYSFGQFLEGFPCNVIGHHWVEKPRSHMSRRERASGRLRFTCTRCFMRAGFTS